MKINPCVEKWWNSWTNLKKNQGNSWTTSKQTLPCKKVPIVGQASSYKEKRSQSGHVSEIRGKSLALLKLTPESPRTKLCPLVVGNPLLWIILETILCLVLDFQGNSKLRWKNIGCVFFFLRSVGRWFISWNWGPHGRFWGVNSLFLFQGVVVVTRSRWGQIPAQIGCFLCFLEKHRFRTFQLRGIPKSPTSYNTKL